MSRSFIIIYKRLTRAINDYYFSPSLSLYRIRYTIRQQSHRLALPFATFHWSSVNPIIFQRIDKKQIIIQKDQQYPINSNSNSNSNSLYKSARVSSIHVCVSNVKEFVCHRKSKQLIGLSYLFILFFHSKYNYNMSK